MGNDRLHLFTRALTVTDGDPKSGIIHDVMSILSQCVAGHRTEPVGNLRDGFRDWLPLWTRPGATSGQGARVVIAVAALLPAPG